jgi:hypothetical protein
MLYHMTRNRDNYRYTDASDAKDKCDDAVETQVCFSRQCEEALLRVDHVIGTTRQEYARCSAALQSSLGG